MPSYLDHFPEPLLSDIFAGRCIPFIGAGFSRNAAPPYGNDMPTWDSLGRQIASSLTDYDYRGPIDAISAYVQVHSRTSLIERLAVLLSIDKIRPGTAHMSFCKLPFSIVCTTNYDNILEQGYYQTRHCHTVVDEDALSLRPPEGAVTLLKPHGDFQHPSKMILTEEDFGMYPDSHKLYSTYIGNLFISHTMLFIGYSMDDPDFRQIWQIIRNRLGSLRRSAYAIKIDASPHEIAMYQRRGISVISLPGTAEDYGAILEQVFGELDSRWSATSQTQSVTVDTSASIEIRLPRGTAKSLCLVVVPPRADVFYVPNVYPMVKAYGFVPVSLDEVTAGGGTIAAKLAMLIDNSALMITDVSTELGFFSIWYAFQRGLSPESLLALVNSDSERERLPGGVHTVVIPQKPEDDVGLFLRSIGKWLDRAWTADRENLESRPRHLLDSGNYLAALLTAIGLLEYRLRRCVAEFRKTEDLDMDLVALVEFAALARILDKSVEDKIRQWDAESLFDNLS